MLSKVELAAEGCILGIGVVMSLKQMPHHDNGPTAYVSREGVKAV